MKVKEIPILFSKRELCCGCTACYAVCPTDSIQMKADNEGFAYPVINRTSCIKCDLCKAVCPIHCVQS